MFIIDAIVYGNPTTYKIKDRDNEPIKTTFYVQELQLIVKPQTYRAEKVIWKIMKGDCELLNVKWKGYPDKFNSYVFQDETELRNISAIVSSNTMNIFCF